jgi:hypothetical protein
MRALVQQIPHCSEDDSAGQNCYRKGRSPRDSPPGSEGIDPQSRYGPDYEMINRRVVKHDKRELCDIPVHSGPRYQQSLLPDNPLAIIESKREGDRTRYVAQVINRANNQNEKQT